MCHALNEMLVRSSHSGSNPFRSHDSDAVIKLLLLGQQPDELGLWCNIKRAKQKVKKNMRGYPVNVSFSGPVLDGWLWNTLVLLDCNNY